MNKSYKFKSKVWLYSGQKASWYFITLPSDIAKDINFYFSLEKKGWGSLPVMVSISTTEWKTSIFPDKETGSYVLPLKAEVRKKENIKVKDEINVEIKLRG